MKIAFVQSHPIIVSSDGVLSQAITWKKLLELRGHKVQLINMWEKNDWKGFDSILFFGFSHYTENCIMWLKDINPNFAVAPILDPGINNVNAYKIYSHIGCRKLHLSSHYYALRKIAPSVKLFFARSEYEKRFLTKGWDINAEKIAIIPLSFSHAIGTDIDKKKYVKEPFCLHISLLADERKNVKRLIEAARKHNFQLILGGKLRNEQEKQLLQSWISNAPNIEYKGFLSTAQMNDLYSRAQVFALPSIKEGVGIVALDAAIMGCDVIITSMGGPKEYYKQMAKVVDPYSVDEIGKAVSFFLNGNTFQPQLKEHIQRNYSLEIIAEKLESSLKSIL